MAHEEKTNDFFQSGQHLGKANIHSFLTKWNNSVSVQIPNLLFKRQELSQKATI